MPGSPMILTPDSFMGWLRDQEVVFFGSGAGKFREICDHPNARFAEMTSGSRELVTLGVAAFGRGDFAETAYAEPFYGKAFHSTAKLQ
jgi:tRNA threonylcarbamoyladenosine biosynthesis protein TsaB